MSAAERAAAPVTTARTLRIRLLLWLLGPLAVVVLLNVVVSYWFAWRPARGRSSSRMSA